MYDRSMKTVTFTIPGELDEQAAAEARRRGISKSELIREGLRAVLGQAAPTAGAPADPWRELAGFGSAGINLPPEEIDDIVYRP